MNRPKLNKNISINDFKSYYWLKEELISFCKEYGLSPSGGKIDIANRIGKFLEFGIIETPQKISSSKPSNQEKPTLDTIITKNYSNSEVNREFFKEVIGPTFKFNVKFMNFFKENIGKTFRDAVEEYYKIQELKKDKNYKTEIDKQFEYNRYFRDFFSDSINKNRSRADAIKCWNYKKSLPEERKYSRNDLKCLSEEM